MPRLMFRVWCRQSLLLVVIAVALMPLIMADTGEEPEVTYHPAGEMSPTCGRCKLNLKLDTGELSSCTHAWCE
jgi:hypothetical protein